MKLKFDKNTLTVTRTVPDWPGTRNGWKGTSKNESVLLHYIKLAMIKECHDVVKVRVSRDGHLFGDDTTQYIRARHPNKLKVGDIYCVVDEMYAVRNLAEVYRKYGEVVLSVKRIEAHRPSIGMSKPDGCTPVH